MTRESCFENPDLEGAFKHDYIVHEVNAQMLGYKNKSSPAY